MPLQITSVHVVRQSVVGRKEKVDGVDLRSLRQRRVHVRQRAVHVGVGRRLAVGPDVAHGRLGGADAAAGGHETLGVGGGSSQVSPGVVLLETLF